jgi:tRNA (guanine-N7-)-methyltransferase
MRTRVRDHVNPFSPLFTVQPEPLNFREIFENPNLPLHVDLGCALGQFVLKMSQIHPEINFLGVDIRELMIERAKRTAEKLNQFTQGYAGRRFANSFNPISRPVF